jgi:hypothetical protein
LVRIGDDDFERAVEATLEILRQIVRRARTDDDALIAYGRLSELLAADGLDVPPHGGLMPAILAAASQREDEQGRGMISALVVQQGGSGPGHGFYRLARRPPFNRQGDEVSVWLTEVRRVRAEDRPADTTTARASGRTVTLDNLGAWLIKCNPEVWDFAAFLRGEMGDIRSWSVNPSYRTDLMEQGQPILFWVTGRDGKHPEPGLWGAGIVAGRVQRDDPDDDPDLWLDRDKRRRAEFFVPVDLQIWDEPVPRRVLQADPRLAGMEIFRQPQMGNPLVVTIEQLAALTEHIDLPPTEVTVTASGAGFGDPASRAEVEQAAVDTVTVDYLKRGWRVTDVSRECLGWDLDCVSLHGNVEHVEVKGVSGVAPAVLLTRNEHRAAEQQQGWRLAVVTQALDDPQLRVVDGATAIGTATPFVYRVDLTDG